MKCKTVLHGDVCHKSGNKMKFIVSDTYFMTVLTGVPMHSPALKDLMARVRLRKTRSVHGVIGSLLAEPRYSKP